MARPIERDITVIGASAGGITALRTILHGLPADYPAAIFVVVHLAPESPSVLPHILDRATRLAVVEARSGAPIRRGTVTIAPPDRHLVLERDRVLVAHGPRENRHRPSIDVLFRSAAAVFGPRATGVVLSGMLDDGAAGLWAIKRQHGTAVVQAPADAEYPDMPRNALEVVKADFVLPVRDMAAALTRIAQEAVAPGSLTVPRNMAMEVSMAAQNDPTIADLDSIGQRSPLTCPECGGVLWELRDGALLRYRCHVGHAYSSRALAAEQGTRVEAALWAALRGLEESIRLSRRLAAAARERGSESSATWHDDIARANEGHAGVLRELVATAPAESGEEATP